MMQKEECCHRMPDLLCVDPNQLEIGTRAYIVA